MGHDGGSFWLGAALAVGALAAALTACTYDVPGLVGPDASVSDTTLPGDERGAGDSGATESSTTNPTPADSGLPSGDSGVLADSSAPDAGDAQVADVARPDTGAVDSGSVSSSVRCGPTLTCTAPKVCCATSIVPGNPSYTCAGETGCTGSNDTPIACDQGSDCWNAGLCCGVKPSPNAMLYTQVSCAATCPYPDVTFCKPGGPKCVQGLNCDPSTLLPGFYVCQ